MSALLRDLAIRWKLLLLIALTSCVSLALTGAATMAYDVAQLKRQGIDAARAQSELLAAMMAPALGAGDATATRLQLGALRVRGDMLCAAAYGLDGRMLASYQAGSGTLCDFPAPEADGWRADGDRVQWFKSVDLNGRNVGSLYVLHRLNRGDRVLSSTAIMTALLLTALLVALLVSARLQHVITGPLMEMAQVARAVTERRDYALRAVKRGNDELGVLADAFNQMLAQIEQTAAALQDTNRQLTLEISEHRRAREAVLALNTTLEQRVAQRTEQLELANKELESFSYSVSHDLRAPLRSIDGFSAALERQWEGQLDPRARDYLDRVRAAAHRMGVLIEDLLKLARTTRVELHRREVNLSALAHGVAAELAAAQPERAVQWQIEPNLTAHADPQLMRAVLDNLLGNAVKFSAARDPAQVVFAAAPVDGQLAYVVRDNGVGFDMAYADKLFGAFQRLHPADQFEGTGVGLANVQRIIHRHGGRVWAHSRPGEGASFFFTLPA